jgi:hypothetical protein
MSENIKSCRYIYFVATQRFANEKPRWDAAAIDPVAQDITERQIAQEHQRICVAVAETLKYLGKVSCRTVNPNG